jgi:hypothetical protein
VAARCRLDRGPGQWHPADPGIARRGDARRHPLPAADRQGHADLRADRDDGENGFVHLPETAPWLALYLHELASFLYGRHDDQVDSTAQLLHWFKASGREDGIFAYYRMLAEERRNRPQRG